MSDVLLTAFGVAIMAIAVWLTVRIINRRERWTKWTAVAFLSVLLGYPLSSGPMAWLSATPDSADGSIERATTAMTIYWPIGRMLRPMSSTVMSDFLNWWLLLGVPRKHCIYVTDDPQGRVSITYCKP